MTLLVRCPRCGEAVVVFQGAVEDLPQGLRLPELIVVAHDEHQCPIADPYQPDC